ncbi:MAG: DUF1178 family protein [Ahrensia sp.]|nr:DUF1178 family protein [Ahrensia sp.]
MKFSLGCKNDHTFEGWFKSNDDFDQQQKRGLIDCPICGSNKVAKTLMAPAVSTGRTRDKISVALGQAHQAEMMAKMIELAREVKAKADNVGDKFAQEARKMHYGEKTAKPIYGKATNDEVAELIDEGVGIMPLPDVPDADTLN